MTTGVRGEHDVDSLVAAIAFDALGGAEALAVVGVAHAGVAVTLAGWTQKTVLVLASVPRHRPDTPNDKPLQEHRRPQTDSGKTNLSSFFFF